MNKNLVILGVSLIALYFISKKSSATATKPSASAVNQPSASAVNQPSEPVLGVDVPLVTGNDMVYSAPTTPTTTSNQQIITFPSSPTYYFEARSNLLKWFSYIPEYLQKAIEKYSTAQIIFDENPTAREVINIPTNSIYIYKANTREGFNYLVPEDIAWAKSASLHDVSMSFGIPE